MSLGLIPSLFLKKYLRILKMPRVTFNSQRKRKSSTKKRRTSNVTRIRYGRTNARSQKKQIMSNAVAIRRMKKLMPPPVYADFQLSGEMRSVPDDTGFSLSYSVVPLMNPATWTNVLRQDPNVLNSVTTRLLRMSINFRYVLRESQRAQMSLFIITLRKNAANKNISGLIDGEDYVRGFEGYQVRLNPSVFKVHYARDVSLSSNGWDTQPFSAGGLTLTSNSYFTFKKGQVNLKMNQYIREPTGIQPWKDMTIDNFGYYQKYHILCFFYQFAPLVTNESAVASVEYDALMTTFNAG